MAGPLTRTRPFWLRPKWVFGHVLCLVLVVTFVNLGFWQLRRMDEREARNARIEARMAADPVPLDEALAGGPDEAEYRRVEVEGRWLEDETVLVRSRALQERPGYHVVTPLVRGDDAVLVNRGFVPHVAGGERAALALVEAPGAGPVQGIVRLSEVRGGIGPQDPDADQLLVVNRIDVARIGEQVDVPLVPVFVQLTAPPARGELPIVLPPPETDDGPHLSYAVQWFIFATVGAVGWPILLRRTARDRGKEEEPE